MSLSNILEPTCPSFWSGAGQSQGEFCEISVYFVLYLLQFACSRRFQWMIKAGIGRGFVLPESLDSIVRGSGAFAGALGNFERTAGIF